MFWKAYRTLTFPLHVLLPLRWKRKHEWLRTWRWESGEQHTEVRKLKKLRKHWLSDSKQYKQGHRSVSEDRLLYAAFCTPRECPPYMCKLQGNVMEPCVHHRESMYPNTLPFSCLTFMLVPKTIIVSKRKHRHLISIILQLLLNKSSW